MIDRRFDSKRRRPTRGTSSETPTKPSDRGLRASRGPQALHRRAHARIGVAALLLAGLSACSSLGSYKARGYQPPTTVSAKVTFGASALAQAQEVDYLQAANTEAALLRRAWLQLQLHRTQDALDSAARVIFTTPPPSAHVEAFARYVRAAAYRAQGLAERGRFDAQRARQLAVDPELQRRLRQLPTVAARPGAGGSNRAHAGAVAWSDLRIQRRGGWRPQPPNTGNLDPMQRPSRVTIHHSAMFFQSTATRAAATQISQIQREHMNNRGYGDIGYHFLIDPSGRIWEGRQLRWQGAHASGRNNIGNIGVCLLGNFVRERNGQGPTPNQIRSMEQLVVALMQRYRMTGDALFCHSDFKSTACPGPRMAPIVKQFARELRARRIAAAAEEDE